MESDLQKKISELEQKIDQMQQTLDQFKQYFKWTMILSIVFFVLPLIAVVIILPMLMNTLAGNYSALL